jgi:hypothetical protein
MYATSNLKLWGVDKVEIVHHHHGTSTTVQTDSHNHTVLHNKIKENADAVKSLLSESNDLANQLNTLTESLDSNQIIKNIQSDIESLMQKDLELDTKNDAAIQQAKSKCVEMESRLTEIFADIDFVKKQSNDDDAELRIMLDNLKDKFNLIKDNINTIKSTKSNEEILEQQRILTNDLVPKDTFTDLKQQVYL